MRIQYPPLESATFRFGFPPIKSLTINLLSELSKVLIHYPKPSDILLLQSAHQVGISLQALQVTPLTFVGKSNTLQLFSDQIVFRFTEYTSWQETQTIILETWAALCEKLNIAEYEDLVILYLDEFLLFPRQDFNITKYFKLNPKTPQTWELNYQDFHIGLNLVVEGGTFIIKLRGVPSDQEENYKIRLESYYRSDKELFPASDLAVFQKRLNDAHRIIVDHFYEILTDRTMTIIGVHRDDATN